MSKAGVIVLFLTGALVGLSLVAWLVGVVLGLGGSLIHLLLLFGLMLAPAGVAVGVLLLVVGRRQQQQQQGGPR